MRTEKCLCDEILELSSELRYASLVENKHKEIQYVWIQ